MWKYLKKSQDYRIKNSFIEFFKFNIVGFIMKDFPNED